MSRHELTDRQWQQLALLLPPERPATGRPNRDHRTILNGILWKLATGAPWRDGPARYGPWTTLYSRFRRWRLAGAGTACSRPSKPAPTRRGSWTGPSTLSMPRSCAPTSTRPGPRGDPAQEALGRSRGGFSTKLHVHAADSGKPVLFVLSGGRKQIAATWPRSWSKVRSRAARAGVPAGSRSAAWENKGYSYRCVRRYLLLRASVR